MDAYNIAIFAIKNLSLFIGVSIFVAIVHEIGHFVILKAAGGNPKITFSFKKGHKTSAYIPKERYKIIQTLSAYNAILYGYFVIMAYALIIASLNSISYIPSIFGVITAYVFGIKKDIKNIKRNLEGGKK